MKETDRGTFEELEQRLKMLLPEGYQDRYDDVLPSPMGSAGTGRYFERHATGADGDVLHGDGTNEPCRHAAGQTPPTAS